MKRHAARGTNPSKMESQKMMGSSRLLISIPFRLVNLPSLRPMVALHAEKPAKAQTTSAARAARTTTMRFATVQALADRTAYRATLPFHGQRCLISLRSVVLILNQLTFTNDTALPEEKPPGCAKCRDRLFGGQEGYFDASCVP